MNFRELNAVPINGWEVFYTSGKEAAINVAASGVGGTIVRGSGKAELSFACQGTGLIATNGAGDAEIDFTANAIGHAKIHIKGSATIVVDADAIGDIVPRNGGTARIQFKATGAGVVAPRVTGAASIGVSASGVGRLTFRGKAEANIDVGAEAKGKLITLGAKGRADITVSAEAYAHIRASNIGLPASIRFDGDAKPKMYAYPKGIASVTISGVANGVLAKLGAGDATIRIGGCYGIPDPTVKPVEYLPAKRNRLLLVQADRPQFRVPDENNQMMVRPDRVVMRVGREQKPSARG